MKKEKELYEYKNTIPAFPYLCDQIFKINKTNSNNNNNNNFIYNIYYYSLSIQTSIDHTSPILGISFSAAGGTRKHNGARNHGFSFVAIFSKS